MRHTIIMATALLAALALSGCGGDGSDISLCKDSCEKQAECSMAIDAESCKSLCESGAADSDMCSNSGEIRSKTKECLNEDSCDDYQSCVAEVPACEE